jgi:hypothetical protein
MTTATAAQNIPFGRGYPVELSTPNTAQIGGSRVGCHLGVGHTL